MRKGKAGVMEQGQFIDNRGVCRWDGQVGVCPQKLTDRQGPLECRRPAHTGLFQAFQSQRSMSFPWVLLQGFSAYLPIWLTENECAGRGLDIPLSRPWL